MIASQDGLTCRHPIRSESLIGYIERVIMGRPCLPDIQRNPLVAGSNVGFFEPSYVFASYMPRVLYVTVPSGRAPATSSHRHPGC